MTQKINIAVQVDAPTPEQFERYLSAHGCVPSSEPKIGRWVNWTRHGIETGVRTMYTARGHLFSAKAILAVIGDWSGMSELEVYNEIVEEKR